jgi:hypothetical protein
VDGLTWIKGEPTTPGWYLLQFSGGDRFVVVKAFYDEENIFRMEDQNNMGYVCDVVDVIMSYLPIPEPPPRTNG